MIVNALFFLKVRFKRDFSPRELARLGTGIAGLV